MSDTDAQTRVEALRIDLQRGLEFHATSFGEIDEKAKYWLTASLPSFIGLAGYGFQNVETLSSYVVAMIWAVCICLFLAIFYLSGTIGSVTVEGGVLLPQDQRFESLRYYTETPENWAQYEEERVKETLSALLSNERQNKLKGRKLGVAEMLLFRAVPSAACVASGCTALINICAAEWGCPGLTGTTTGTAAGAAGGSLTAAAFWAVAHFRTPKNTVPGQ